MECSQSNAFGIPLDFHEHSIVDFRFSTILSLFTQNVEVDYQYCNIAEGGITIENTQFTTDRNEEKSLMPETKSTKPRMMILRKHIYQTLIPCLNTTMPKR